MKMTFHFIIFLVIFNYSIITSAQIPSGIYFVQETVEGKTRHYEVKISKDYFVQNIYDIEPNKFIKTVGGFFTIANDTLNLKLEFNSNYEKDSIREVRYPFSFQGDQLRLRSDKQLTYRASENLEQELDGYWLFATRGPDAGQERRGEKNARKTLKILQDNTFQWIAYHTETMKFSGTGGGSFSSENGVYTENIKFFSRDDSRVGAQLEFDYELKGDDWHHTGKNSKGNPMYEIWSRREP